MSVDDEFKEPGKTPEVLVKYPKFAAMLTMEATGCDCVFCKAWRELEPKLLVDGEIANLAIELVDKFGPVVLLALLKHSPEIGMALRLLADKRTPPEAKQAGVEAIKAVAVSQLSLTERGREVLASVGETVAVRAQQEDQEQDDDEDDPQDNATDTQKEDTDMATINNVTMDVAKGEPVKAKPPMSGKWKEMGIVREGDRIVLPDGMTHNEAIEWIKRRRDEEQRTVGVHEEIVGYPLDAAIAFVRALQEVKGFISLEATPSFFGETPPTMVTVEVGVGETTQVPWGRMVVPGIEGFLQTGIGKKDDLPILVVGGEVQMRFREEVAYIANVARRILKESSIYHGKAIRVRFPDEEEDFNPGLAPTFVDVSKVQEDQLIFPEAVQRQVTTSIFTPIMHTEKCRAAKIPLKRGILLEGPYGTGKTLTAYVTAKKCQENGWTFIYLDTVAHLEQAILFARSYQPACIFAEDIDRVVEGERTVEMDAILNTIDGVDTKSAELMVILTTNHVEDINRAMLRPGRLDAVIPVRAPDAAAAERLIRQYGATMLRAGDDLTEVGKRLAGQIPAVIREVVERSKLSAVAHSASDGGALEVTADDLFTAADGMVTHLELLAQEEDEETPGEAMARVFGEKLGAMLNSNTLVVPSMRAIEREAGVNGSSKKTA